MPESFAITTATSYPSCKTTIIEVWLRPAQRRNSCKHDLSAGIVTNTLREWRLGLDEAVPDELCEFALALNCGLRRRAEVDRIVSMMTNLGIQQNDFYRIDRLIYML